MRKLSISIVVMAMAVLTGCSNDDEGMGGINTGTGNLIIQAIQGNWIATSATFTTVNVNPVQSRELIADGGFCDLSVSQNGNFTLVVRNPGTPDPQITTGQMVADGDFINVRFDSEPDVEVRWDFVLSGDNLSIAGPLAYDFENDGVFEEVSANLQFIPS